MVGAQRYRTLVTGVAGFIGSNLADRLVSEGHRVVGIDNLSYSVPEQIPEGIEFHKLDIRSKDIYQLFDGVDLVFHLAAKNTIPDCQDDPVETSDINITGTLNIFEASRRAKVKKVIYAETAALYEGITKIPLPEDEIKPESFYGVSKLCGHMFAEAYQRYFGLKTVGLRYFNVYGPRQDYRRTIPPAASAFIIKLLRGEEPIIYGDGKRRFDFVHVDDINEFHILCMDDTRVDNKVFNLGSGKDYSILELYSTISNLLGVKVEAVHKPPLVGGPAVSLANISRAKALGWSPKVSLEDGLIGMINYIKKEFAKGRIR